MTNIKDITVDLTTTLNETVAEVFKKHNDELQGKLYQFEKNKLYAYLGSLRDSLKKHKAFIAGGTITSLFTGTDINDIDIYFRNEESLIEFIDEHWMDGESFVTCLTKKSALMVKGKEPDFLNLQMIHFKYFNTVQEIFDTFDFTVCMGAFDFETEQFTLHDNFMKHNSQRILKFNPSTAFPIVSLLRVHKYSNKKYSISKPELIRILLKCMTLNIDTIEKLKEHLGGMYGINYDKIINLDEGEEFSLDLFIEKIADIALSEDYFKKPAKIEFDDLEEIIQVVKKSPFKVIKLDDVLYWITSDGGLREFENKGNAALEHVTKEDFFENARFYKWVEKVSDGEYKSHREGSFTYKDGEKSTAKGNHLWFTEKSKIYTSTYSRRGVLIECKTTHEDFNEVRSDDVLIKSCVTIREVPKEEWEQWGI